MPGGLVQFSPPFLQTDDLLISNDSKLVMFQSVYKKHRNFAIQRFRLDYNNNADFSLSQSTKLTFKIKRYADLLYDAALCLTLPNIYSPILHPNALNGNKWTPYEFRWIDNIGAHCIKEVSVIVGGQIIQKFSGETISALVERDFSQDKKRLFDEMTGNIPELNNPAYAFGRNGVYPSTYFTTSELGAEPSIRSRQICIPLQLWFSEDKHRALPIAAITEMDIFIEVNIRPMRELIRVRDVTDSVNGYPYIQPNLAEDLFQLYRFLQTPPSSNLSSANYGNQLSLWDLDAHLNCAYIFLDEAEKNFFLHTEQRYLIPTIQEHLFYGQFGTAVLKIPPSGLATSWIIKIRRNDASMRNEWDNYTNWPYKFLPQNVRFAPYRDTNGINDLGPGVNPDTTDTGICITGNFNTDNVRHILQTAAIKINGEYRENRFSFQTYQYLTRYNFSNGYSSSDSYHYNFCLLPSNSLQPTGYLNTSKYNKIELELSLYTPPISSQVPIIRNICDSAGNVVGTQKENYRLYEYAYDIIVIQTGYNLLSVHDGNVYLVYA